MHSITISALFARQAQPLTRYLTRKTGDVQLAEDLVQESFVRLALQLRQGAVDNIEAYLRRTARNLLVDHLRQRDRQRTVPCEHGTLELMVDPAPGPYSRVAEARRNALLARAIDQLPPRTAAVLRLTHLEGLTQAAVAKRLNISASCVQKHLVKAFWMVPRRLQKQGLEGSDG